MPLHSETIMSTTAFRADRRIERRSTAASDGEGPLNGPEAGHIGRISREARPSPGARPARGQAHRRPLTPGT